MSPDLRVSEVFYSLQGEGARVGQSSLFVRLQGCSAKHACYESGVRCDTEFESGTAMSMPMLLAALQALSPDCKWIIWTGGEPLDQLTAEQVQFFRDEGYQQALETSGVRPLSPALRDALDWIACSPKVAEHVLLRNFPESTRAGRKVHVDELRYVRHKGQGPPNPSLSALAYFVSPHFDGVEMNAANLRHCITICLNHPQWKLSLQTHKMHRIL